MKKFLPYMPLLKPVKWHFVGGIIAGIIYGASSAAGIPAMVKTVFPAIFHEPGAADASVVRFARNTWGENYQDELLILCVSMMPLIFLVRASAMYLNRFLLNYTSQYVLETLRNRVYQKVLFLSVSYYDKTESGKIMQKIMGDTERLKMALILISSDLIIQPIMVLSAVSFLLYQCFTESNTAFAMIALLSVPLCVLPIRMIGRKMKRNYQDMASQIGRFQSEIIESLQSPKEIKSFNLEPLKEETFASSARGLFSLSVKNTKYEALISPSIEFVAMLGFTLALYVGAQGGMSNSTFMSMGLALYFAYEPVKKLGKIKANLKLAEVALDRLETILHMEDDVPDTKAPVKLPSVIKGEITFDEVTFKYGGNDAKKQKKAALKNTTIKLHPGECIALVGASGAGKTTFMNLIPRFYEATEGKISLDGIDIKEMSKKDLRDQIAIVPQSPQLFADTIYNNIRMGKLDASKEEIIQAAKHAAAHEFITSLPKGYNTNVGEKGQLLSGGQRQRISIARAFLKDSPILLLDEATSALDNESEAEIQEALKELTKDRTTLMIAHRFSSLKNATRTLYFEDGTISADGTHEEMLLSNSAYKKLYNTSYLS